MMSIYHICTDCPDKPFCDADGSPYDERCSKHEQFIHNAQMNRNMQYFRTPFNTER